MQFQFDRLAGHKIARVEPLKVDWKQDGSLISDVLRFHVETPSGGCNIFYLFSKPDEKYAQLNAVTSMEQFFQEFTGVNKFFAFNETIPTVEGV